MSYVKLREYNGRGEFEFNMGEPLESEADFKLTFHSNAQITVEASFFLSPETARIIQENQKGPFEISLSGKVRDPSGYISIEKMFINTINIDFKKGKTVKVWLELFCFSFVDITFLDKKN